MLYLTYSFDETNKVVLREKMYAGFIDKVELFPTESGTPYGGIASPLLAHMYWTALKMRFVGLSCKLRMCVNLPKRTSSATGTS